MSIAADALRRDVNVIGLVALAHGLSHFFQITTAVLFPLIKDDLGVSYTALGAAGFAGGFTNPSRDLIVRAATPAGSTGKVYGFVYSGLDVGSIAAPVAFGWFLDRGAPAAVFYAVVGVLALSILTVLRLPERAPQPR